MLTRLLSILKLHPLTCIEIHVDREAKKSFVICNCCFDKELDAMDTLLMSILKMKQKLGWISLARVENAR